MNCSRWFITLSLSVTKIWNLSENFLCTFLKRWSVPDQFSLSLSLFMTPEHQIELSKKSLEIETFCDCFTDLVKGLKRGDEYEKVPGDRWSATDAVCQMICHSCSVGRGSIQPFCVFNNPTFSGLSETWNFRTFGDQVWCLALVRNWKICWFLINSQEVCPFLAYSPNVCIVHVAISFCQFSATFLIYTVLQFWLSKTMKNKEIPFIPWENSEICIEFFQKQAKPE